MLKYGWGQGKVWGPKRIQDNDGVTQAFTLVLPSLPTVTPASPPIAGSALGSVLPFLLTLGALAGYSKPARGNASPSNHIHPPAKRFYTNSVAIKMYSMTLLILSSGHFTSFLGQIFSHSKLFLKLKGRHGEENKIKLLLANSLRNACSFQRSAKDYSPHPRAEIFSIQRILLWCH